jgi:hypothetical protein
MEPVVKSLAIGYSRLTDFIPALDITQPVYVVSHVETTHGTVPGQRCDHHYIMVTHPDVRNRIHYCRISVVQLVYHNGIAFAPDCGEQLGKVDAVQREVEAWIVGEGFMVRQGMVALPEGIILIDGSLSN